MQMLAYELGTSARDEILLLYSTANALNRQSKLGALQALEEVANKSRLKIRLLTPFDDSLKQLVQDLTKYADVRYIPEELQTKITIAIIDRKWSIVVELKDDSKNSSYEAMGLGTFSNSPSTVASYVSIFETLWKHICI
jgi:two-component system sensor histidine kinase VicK